MDTTAVLLWFSLSVFVRWGISTFPYSGKGKPVMFGDYEAQRHWQEITVNLPPSKWYKNSTDNDLLYWGLDYPPLTAYHSWIVGQVALRVNSSWVELFKSRGSESYNHQLFMRYSVLLSDLVTFFPACLFYAFYYQGSEFWKVLLALLFYPGLSLIDYGHFQYNGVSLGFFLFAVAFISQKKLILGSVSFCLALNYKQMELYHALPFFFYILGYYWHQPKSVLHRLFNIVMIGAVVIASFAACWLPFLTSLDDVMAVIYRLFPFSRGLFEDKVSNFWCSLNIIIKIKNFLPQPTIVKLCAVTTLLSVAPSSIHLLGNPTIENFKYSLIISSLGFFLLSYQVHEKTILIPALSTILLTNEDPFMATWFALSSIFSMIPLFLKDELTVAVIGTSIPYLVLMVLLNRDIFSKTWQKLLITVSCLGMVILSICSVAVSPPPKLPDLWPVLLSAFSCAHFVFYFIYFNFRQLCTTGDKNRKDKKS